jgi:hypothetical protein
MITLSFKSLFSISVLPSVAPFQGADFEETLIPGVTPFGLTPGCDIAHFQGAS